MLEGRFSSFNVFLKRISRGCLTMDVAKFMDLSVS